MVRYRENLYSGERLTSTELLDEDCPLELAKHHAVYAVKHGRADRAQICKLTGKTVYVYPRKNAPNALRP